MNSQVTSTVLDLVKWNCGCIGFRPNDDDITIMLFRCDGDGAQEPGLCWHRGARQKDPSTYTDLHPMAIRAIEEGLAASVIMADTAQEITLAHSRLEGQTTTFRDIMDKVATIALNDNDS